MRSRRRHQQGAEAFCINPVNGKAYWRDRIRWSEKIDGRILDLEFFRGAFLKVEDFFICLSEIGSLLTVKMDKNGWKIISKNQLNFAHGTWTKPALSKGLLYDMQNETDRRTGQGPRILCYDLRKGDNTAQTIEVQPLSGFKKALAYLVDEKLAPLIKLGSLVKIPLGHRKTLGIVSSLTPESTPPSVEKLKFVLSLIREDPVLSPDLLSLARWMSGYYASSIESILEGMIPAAVRDGTGEKTQRMLESTELGSTEKGKQLVIRSPKQRLLLDHLIEKAAPVPLNETVKTLGVGQSVAKGLVAKGLAREKKDAVIRVAYCDELMDSVEEVYTEVKLTDEQSKASGEIKESLKANSFSTHLLLGITGSGKRRFTSR